MKPNAVFLTFCLLQLYSMCSCDEGNDLKVDAIDVEALTDVFKYHGRDFLMKLKSVFRLIPRIARAEFQLILGTSNTTSNLAPLFGKLQMELDYHTQLFKETVQKIDPKVDISILECISVIREVMFKRQTILDAPADDRADLVKEFDDLFVKKLIITSDVFFDSLWKRHHPDQQLFEKFARESYQHPVLTNEFMHGCYQILTQLIMLEANHIELSLDSEDAFRSFENKAVDRLAKVWNLMKAIDSRQHTDADMMRQIAEDQKRLHMIWQPMSHCDFARHAKTYFDHKYLRYKFLVVSYSVVRGYDSHAFVSCAKMSYLFEYYSRNTIIIGFPPFYLKSPFFAWAKNILDTVPSVIRVDKDKAATVLHAIDVRKPGTCAFGFIHVVTSKAALCHASPAGQSIETSKTAEVCNTGLCWIKNKHLQRVIAAGRL